jgi:S-adenosylmethionine-diacylgycerolhomoserine-N-methlytransferase
MLQTARESIAREGLTHRIWVEFADATSFDPMQLFGVEHFDRVVVSYALSMIPEWKVVLKRAPDLLAPKGALYIVDFGDQAELPNWFRRGLFEWLDYFSVTPRLDLCEELSRLTLVDGQSSCSRKLYRGYAVLGELHVR